MGLEFRFSFCPGCCCHVTTSPPSVNKERNHARNCGRQDLPTSSINVTFKGDILGPPVRMIYVFPSRCCRVTVTTVNVRYYKGIDKK